MSVGESTCGHDHPDFLVTIGPQQRRICWTCLIEEIQESRVGHVVIVVRMED